MFWTLGIGLPLLAALMWAQRRARRVVHADGTIDYGANPFRIGARAYIMEMNAPSDLDWHGTYIGMSDGMALIRDNDTLVVTHVNKDQVYGLSR